MRMGIIIASSFGLIFCHATSSNVCNIRYQLNIKFSYFFFNILITQNHKLKMATEKRLFRHLLIHCLYSCCGSLDFTIIFCIVFTGVVDPWCLQLFVDPWSLQLLMLSSLGLYICWWSLVFTVINVFEPLSLQLFVDISCSLEDLKWRIPLHRINDIINGIKPIQFSSLSPVHLNG